MNSNEVVTTEVETIATEILPIPEQPAVVRRLHEIGTLDDYLIAFGPILGRKAIESLKPLHIPGVDEIPDFSDIPDNRQPFDCQAGVIAASVKMFNKMGSGFICGEMGTGKTLLGILAFDRHARQPRSKGGKGGKYRAVVLCPDHLIGKWAREITETIPDAKITRFGPQDHGEKKETRRVKKTKSVEVEHGATRQALADTLRLLGLGEEDTKVIDGDAKSSRERELYVCVGKDGEVETKTEATAALSGKCVQRKKRWTKPEGAEWFILGQNQAKWMSHWAGVADTRPGFNGDNCRPLVSKKVVVKEERKLDDKGYQVYDKETGQPVKIKEYGTLFLCPKCGDIIKDDKGKPLSESDLKKVGSKSTQKTCKAKVAYSLHDPEHPKIRANDFMFPGPHNLQDGVHRIPGRYMDKKVGDEFKHNGMKWVIAECGEPLFQYTKAPYRWAPARIIQKQLRGMFDYLAIDECFPGHTGIMTSEGTKPIKDVRPGDWVYSMKDGEIVLRAVTRLIAKRSNRPLVRVNHSGGSFSCTPNHQTFTRDGKTSARDLVAGDELFFVEDDRDEQVYRANGLPSMRDAILLDDQAAEQEVLLPVVFCHEGWDAGDEALPILRGDVYERANQVSPVLLQDLLGFGEMVRSGVQGSTEKVDGEQVRQSDSCGIGTHESNEQKRGVQGEVGCGEARKAVRGNSRRQWPHFPGAEDSRGRYRVRLGASSEDGQPTMEMCIVGPGECRPEDRSRGGRVEPPDGSPEVEGREKEADAGQTRLDDDSFYERTGPIGSRRSPSVNPGMRIERSRVVSVVPDMSDDEFVYDLEVEDTHCYFAEGVLVSNCHEQKSDFSARSMAAGKILASCRHVLGLTGTIIGGYADHLYPLLMRITPKTLKEEGFEWGADMKFSEQYGKIEYVVTTSEGGKTSVDGRAGSMRKSTGKTQEKKNVKPGIMPTMFGRHMIANSMFITLEEMSDELPDLFEYVGGAMPPAPTPGDFDDEDKFNTALDLHVRAESGWVEVACDMEPEQKKEYDRVASALENANIDLLCKGSMKLLGAYLWTTMDYPDRPFGWGFDPELMKAARDDDKAAPALLGQSFLKHFNQSFDPTTKTLSLTKIDTNETDRVKLRKEGGTYLLDVHINGKKTPITYDTGASSVSMSMGLAHELGVKPKPADYDSMASIADGSTVKTRSTLLDSVAVGKFTVKDVECSIVPPGKLTHTVGYWEEPGNRKVDNWVGVVTPKDCPEDRVYPKEQALIDICLKQKGEGTQTWVYVNMTNKRNIQPRLKKLLEDVGLKVGILRAADVSPVEREAWIAAQGKSFDVMISHPQLVSTGLDLFTKEGHNYSTIVFYETGYNLFTMRQASRRAWRIGQKRDCRVYYLYYKGTMQHKAMQLMSKKMAAAQALEGEFSADGLAAMAGEDNAQLSLAKNLSASIAETDLQRSWVKVKASAKKKKPGIADAAKDIPPSPLDDFPIELQMTAESIIEGQKTNRRRANPVKLVQGAPPTPLIDIEVTPEMLAEFDRIRPADTDTVLQMNRPEFGTMPDLSGLIETKKPNLKLVSPPEPDCDGFDTDGELPDALNAEDFARLFASLGADSIDLSSFLD